nr:hypothetical protein [Sandaracinus amylolyticus]
MLAEALHDAPVTFVDLLSVPDVEEHTLMRLGVAAQDLVRRQSAGDAAVERPGARIVGLVVVEADGAAFEIEIAPREPGCLGAARSLSVEEAVEQPMRQVDMRRPEQPGVLVRVEERHRLPRADLRQVPLRKRVRGNDATGERSERKHAAHDLCDVAPGRARERVGQGAHHHVGVLEGELA